MSLQGDGNRATIAARMALRAESYALKSPPTKASARRAHGMTRTTAVHICFGYAAIIHVRPDGYSFLPELADSPVQQVSIKTGVIGIILGSLASLTKRISDRASTRGLVPSL
jgi:5-methyltetrahydropteroyltriglutamate--homocysteine methyltransferase